MPELDKAALALHKTDRLIDHYEQTTSIPRSVLESTIPLAIDVAYEARDRSGNMHSAAAAVAVAVILATQAEPFAPAPDPATWECATWECRIGEISRDQLPSGADGPMRDAVEAAYVELTGRESGFIFSGWDGRLTAHERAVVDGEKEAE